MKIYAFADEASADFGQQVKAMKENALDGLEIRNVDGVSISDMTEDRAGEIRKRLDGEGLEVWSIGSPIGKISLRHDDFAAHLEKFKHTLELAGILDAKCIRLFSFYIDKGEDPDACREEVIERMGRLVEAAEGYPVTLCHENEKGIYGDLAPRCLEIHKALPKLAGVFDPANFIQCGQDTLEAWEMLKPYIKYMHVKDALADGYVVPAGKGIGNLKRIAEDFIARGGDVFTIEPHLAIFEGLSRLEREGERRDVGKYAYEDGRSAFDAACREFRSLMEVR